MRFFLLTGPLGAFQLGAQEIEMLSILIHRAFHAAPEGAKTGNAMAFMALAQGNASANSFPVLIDMLPPDSSARRCVLRRRCAVTVSN
jgi:hypothetical protein